MTLIASNKKNAYIAAITNSQNGKMNQNGKNEIMFIVHKIRGGKPIKTSDNNVLPNGMLCAPLQREGWRIATDEEMKEHYPEYKPEPKGGKGKTKKTVKAEENKEDKDQ